MIAAAISSFSYAGPASLAAPTGAYSGSKSVLGEKIDATFTFGTATMVVAISGAISVDCKAEAYTFAAPKVDITNIGKAGDCVHDTLAKEKVSIEDVEFSSSADALSVTAKYGFLPITFTLSKATSESEAEAPVGTTAAEHAAWFEAFKLAFGKSYAAEEHAFRFGVFRDNLAVATERNQQGEARHGVTKFMDLSAEEFRATYLGYKPKRNALEGQPVQPALPRMAANATSAIDWRSKTPAVLTPVKDQGQCGSCWAFSATEQIETNTAMATGKLLTLSPQQITSCDKVDQGCGGGNTETAYAYVQKAGGIEPNTDYPYASGKTGKSGTCTVDKAEEAVTISGFTSVSKGASGEAAMVAQMQKSPISICVDASSWQTYAGGVVGMFCGKQLDHCVQAVGLGTKKTIFGQTENYWIVRNSWNTNWGHEGYIYVKEGGNYCGIANDATVVTGAKIEHGVTLQ